MKRSTSNAHRSAVPGLISLFLKLGFTAFGGPAAHIAMMEDEVVHKRKWLSREAFLDLVGAVNLIPGPNSTELAIHVGLRQAGWLGWFLAGACFILPAALITAALAWAYVEYGKLPAMQGVLYGVKPVVMVIVAQALWRLGKTAVNSRFAAGSVIAAAAMAFLGVHELLLLLVVGIATALARNVPKSGAPASGLFPGLVGTVTGAVAATAAVAAAPFTISKLFLFFLKVGSVLFGSGYVLLAFLRADLVERWGWLREEQLIDAVAIGQVTPGPVFTTATFIGYLLGGPAGAVVATVGIFLPAFVFVAISGPLIPRIRSSPVLSAFLDGVNVASLALMGVVTFHLGRSAFVDVWSVGLALLSAVLLFRFSVNSSWLILGSAAIGMILRRQAEG